MRSCVAVDCSNRQLKSSPISFHEFPADVEKRLEWIKSVRRKEWSPGDRAVLCSEHFTADCFYTSVSGRKFLKRDALPTIFKGSNRRLPRRTHPVVQPKITPPTVHEKVSSVENTFNHQVQNWHVDLDHSYSANIPPEVANEKLKCERDQNYKLRRKIEGLQKQLKRNEKALSDAVKLVALSRKASSSEVVMEQSPQTFPSKLPIEILKRFKSKTNNPDTVSAYPDSLKDFAMKLHLCSPKAYRLVRESFQLSLPSESIIKKWNGKGDGSFDATSPPPNQLKRTKKKSRRLSDKLNEELPTEQHLEQIEVIDFGGQDRIELYSKDEFDVEEFFEYQ